MRVRLLVLVPKELMNASIVSLAGAHPVANLLSGVRLEVALPDAIALMVCKHETANA